MKYIYVLDKSRNNQIEEAPYSGEAVELSSQLYGPWCPFTVARRIKGQILIRLHKLTAMSVGIDLNKAVA